MHEQSVAELKKFVASVTNHHVYMVRFDDCDERICKRNGLPFPVALELPETLGRELPRFDPQTHKVVQEVVCVSKAHKKLSGIACMLLQMGVCLVRTRTKKN